MIRKKILTVLLVLALTMSCVHAFALDAFSSATVNMSSSIRRSGVLV